MAAKSKKAITRTAVKSKPVAGKGKKATKPVASKKAAVKAAPKKSAAKAAPKATKTSAAVVYASALREMIAKRLGRS